MPNKTRGVGLFTAENIVAVIRAIPESDGTYRDVARKAEPYGGNVQYHTISNWASHGRAGNSLDLVRSTWKPTCRGWFTKYEIGSAYDSGLLKSEQLQVKVQLGIRVCPEYNRQMILGNK